MPVVMVVVVVLVLVVVVGPETKCLLPLLVGCGWRRR